MKRNTIILDEILQKLNSRIEHLEVCISNVIPILQHIMEIVEKTRLKGPQKKGLAISLLKGVIINSNLKNEDKEDLYNVINNGIMSDTIDLVISASNRKLKLNRKSIMKKLSSKTLRKNKDAVNLQRKFAGDNKRRRKSSEKSNQ